MRRHKGSRDVAGDGPLCVAQARRPMRWAAQSHHQENRGAGVLNEIQRVLSAFARRPLNRQFHLLAVTYQTKDFPTSHIA